MTIKNVSEVLAYLDSHTWKETAKKFDISEMSISRLNRKYSLVKNELIANNPVSLINKIAKNFVKLVQGRKLSEMNAVELRVLYFLVEGKSKSLTKKQYVSILRRRIK